jgi:hypothetical protein
MPAALADVPADEVRWFVPLVTCSTRRPCAGRAVLDKAAHFRPVRPDQAKPDAPGNAAISMV